MCCGSIDILIDPGLNKKFERIQICVAEGPQVHVQDMLHVRPTPHPLHFHCIANNCALWGDVRFVRFSSPLQYSSPANQYCPATFQSAGRTCPSRHRSCLKRYRRFPGCQSLSADLFPLFARKIF